MFERKAWAARARRLRVIALCSMAVSLLQSVWAASAAAPPQASRTDGQWEVSKTGDAAPAKIDDQPVVQAAAGRIALNKLMPGLHVVKIGSIPPLTLLIRESGTRSSGVTPSPTRVFSAVVDDPKLHHAAPTLRVMQGEVVQLDISSASPIEVHLHGYDIEGRVGPGMALSIAFDANLAGRFSLETHGQTHNAFAYLEVLPR